MTMPKAGKMLVALILLAISGGMVFGQEPGAPENLMVGRLGDTFDVIWDAPEGLAVEYYNLNIRWRATRDGDWISSSGFSIFDTAASLSVEHVQELGGGQSPLYAAEFTVHGVISNTAGPTASVTWTSPPPKRSARKAPSKETKVKKVEKPRLPAPDTCALMTNSGGGTIISSPLGLTNGIQCQQIGAAGIGILSIIQAGFIDAVDVWGNVTEATVCFKQYSGVFLFLDATTAPRSISSIEGFDHDSMRCATIGGPGSVILVPMIA